MLDQSRLAVAQLRDSIERDEQNRTDPLRRQQLWNAAQWEDKLARLRAEEDSRDTAALELIEQRAQDRDAQARLEQDLAQALDADVAWLQECDSELHRLSNGWGLLDPGDRRVEELGRHRYLVRLRLLDRQVLRAQVILYSYERHRRAYGRVSEHAWATTWGALQSAWAEQDTFLNQTQTDSQLLLDQRRSWLHGLSAYQEATLATGSAGVDTNALRWDMSQVAQAINFYDPPRAPAGSAGGGGLGAIIAVVVVGLFLAMLLRGGAASAPSPQPAPLAPVTPGQGGALSSSEQQPSIAALVPAAQAVDLLLRGNELQRAGQCAEAVPVFEQAIAADPVLSSTYSFLAFCLFELGRIDEAIARWEEATARNPADADALAGLGMALYLRGEQGAGQDRYREAVAIDARYADEGFLRGEARWNEASVVASRPLRGAQAP